jgi:hypothetical protein
MSPWRHPDRKRTHPTEAATTTPDSDRRLALIPQKGPTVNSEMNSVSRGVNRVYIGLFMVVVGALVFPILAGLAVAAVPLAVTLFLVWGAVVLVTVGTIVGLIGRINCLSVPETVQATGVIYAAVACDVLALLISIGSASTELPALLEGAQGQLSLIASVLFVIFLKRVAKHIGDAASEKRAHNLLVLGGITVAVMIGVFVLPPLALVFLLLVIVMFFIYVRLLLSLRSSLASA